MLRVSAALLCTAALALSLFNPGSLFAQEFGSDIIVEQFTGEVQVTLPDGTVVTLEPGLPVPPIPSGSQLEVITGTAVIEVMGVKISMVSGSAVKIYDIDQARRRFKVAGVKGESELFIGLMKATLSEGDDISVRIDPRNLRALITVLEGSVTVEENGVITVLEKNDRFLTLLPFFPEDPRVPPREPPEPEPIEASPFLP